MTLVLLLAHALAGAALLGALTHQCVAAWRLAPRAVAGQGGFMARYGAVGARGFTLAVVVLYLAVALPGGLVYPAYRLDVRIPFEEMDLWWAVGLFEAGDLRAALVEFERAYALSSRPSLLYNLGATLYHLLAGRVPFDAPSSNEVLVAILTDPVPRLASRSGGLRTGPREPARGGGPDHQVVDRAGVHPGPRLRAGRGPRRAVRAAAASPRAARRLIPRPPCS